MSNSKLEMIIHLFCIFLLIGGGSTTECDTAGDCDDSWRVCDSNGGCAICTTANPCSPQHTMRTTCGSSNRCVQCISDTDCDLGETCVIDDSTFLCATPCPSPPATCPSNSQCIYISNDSGIGGAAYCLSCENNADCRKWTDLVSATATPICDSGTCVQCKTDSDCPSETAAQCSGGTCVGCTDSSQCTRFSSTPACNSTSGKCVECIHNDNCTSIEKPDCEDIEGQCGLCYRREHCSRFSPELMCHPEIRSCVQCITDSNCSNAAAAQCSDSNICIPCTANTHCAHFVTRRSCKNPEAGGTCVQCLDHSNCTSETAAKCDSNTCVPCTDSTQCTHFNTTKLCDTLSGGGGKCVECLSDSDCASETASRCSGGTCVPCTDSSQCTRFSSTPICNSTSGECVECLSISDCPDGKICSPSGVCVGCTSSTQCTINEVLFCNTTIGECVECLADADCLSATESHCSLDSNICAPCTISSQCEHLPDTPLCNTTLGGICVECNIDSDCSSALTAHCSSASDCGPCTDSAHCAHLSSTPVCNITTGACVECLVDADCSSMTPSKCLLTNNTCVACYHYQNSCYTVCPNGTSPDSTNYTCIQNITTTCKSSSDCLAAADKTHPECNGTMCVACSADSDCRQWHSQVEMTCNIISGACMLVVDPIVETAAAVASTVTTSAVIAVSGAVTINAFTSAGSASRGFSTLRITKLAALLRYININAPYQVEKLFEGFTRPQTFMKKMLVGLFDEEQYNQTMINLPKRFVKFEDSSLFLKNAGMIVLISVGVGLAILLCRIGMHKARKKRSRTWTKRFLSLQKIVEWNYILGMIMGSYPDLLLGFGLQMYDLPFSNPTPLSLISLVICVLVTPISILFPLICWFLMSATNKGRNRKYHNISRYEVFIADFKENNSDTKTYQMISLLRIQAMVFPLIFWQGNPLAQILFMMVGSIAVNFIHATKVSYKSRFTNFVILTGEFLLFLSMIGVLLQISISSSSTETNNSNHTSAVGWLIAIPLIVLMIFNALVSLLGVLKYIWNIVKAARNRPQAPPISNRSLDLSNRSMRRLVSPLPTIRH